MIFNSYPHGSLYYIFQVLNLTFQIKYFKQISESITQMNGIKDLKEFKTYSKFNLNALN